MEKISEDPVCFVVSLKEIRKYGLCPLGQLKRNPEAKNSQSYNKFHRKGQRKLHS